MKTLLFKILTILIFLCFVIIILVVRPANANGDHQTPKTEYIYIHKDDDNTKYVIGGAILTCAVLSIWKQRWCWEDKTPEPFPDTGPAVKDIAPDQLYMFEVR